MEEWVIAVSMVVARITIIMTMGYVAKEIGIMTMGYVAVITPIITATGYVAVIPIITAMGYVAIKTPIITAMGYVAVIPIIVAMGGYVAIKTPIITATGCVALIPIITAMGYVALIPIIVAMGGYVVGDALFLMSETRYGLTSIILMENVAILTNTMIMGYVATTEKSDPGIDVVHQGHMQHKGTMEGLVQDVVLLERQSPQGGYVAPLRI